MKRSNILTIVLLTILFLIIISFLWLQNQNHRKNVETLEESIKYYQEVENEYVQQIKQIQNEVNQLKGQIAPLKEENKKLREEQNKLESEKEKLKKEIENLKKENNSLKQKIAANQTNKPTNSGNKPNNSETNNSNGEKIAYLTFDDGPSANTITILDTLKDYGIKATFFVNGRTGEKEKEIYKRIVNEGHSIGNHTYSHDYKTIYSSVDAFKKDFMKLEDLLYEIVQQRPKIIRYPGGSNNTVSHKYGGKQLMSEIIEEMKNDGYIHFDWNVDSQDASANSVAKDKIISNVLNGSKNKNTIIVLMHDSSAKKTTAEALPSIIKGLQEQGFTFKTLDENSTKIQFVK